jgi:hypothetical protein
MEAEETVLECHLGSVEGAGEDTPSEHKSLGCDNKEEDVEEKEEEEEKRGR